MRYLRLVLHAIAWVWVLAVIPASSGLAVPDVPDVALTPACNGFMVHRHGGTTGMGIDSFGHTRMSEARRMLSIPAHRHVLALMSRLRGDLTRYRSYRAAIHDGYALEGADVPVGALKHFFNYANYQKNFAQLDPDAPAAILYRRTASGYDLAGVMFTAPIGSSMDDLDSRVPLALGHWHSHRNICVQKDNPQADLNRFGFSGSIATRAACAAAGGSFIDNVYGWMVHIYPYEETLDRQF